jgi:hypothetical protein
MRRPQVDDFTPDRTDPRLQRALRERLAAPRGDCPDPERLAAWSEGALAPADAAALETHLADCARCQAVIASFAATDGIESSTAAPAVANTGRVVPFTPRQAMKWALPLAAGIAATFGVWTMTRDTVMDRAVAPADRSAAESSQALGTPVPPAAYAPPPAAAPPAPAAQSGSLASERRPAERDAAKTSVDQLRDRLAPANPQGQIAPVATPTFRTAAAPPPPPPAVVTPPPARPDSRASTITGLPQSTINVTIDGVVKPGARLDAVEALALDAKPIAQFASTAIGGVAERAAANAVTGATAGAAGGTTGRAAGGGRGGGGGRAGGSGAGAARVAAPAADLLKAETTNLPAHWRIFVGNRVERSRDNGLTWTAIKVDAGLPSITNGAAPAGQICWLVGARGLVLVSADATTFARVAAPAEVDLVSIQAVDARSAVVTAADGRTFTTIDGGKTWK